MKTGIASGFIRKHAVVEAVRVTSINMAQVARWCDGRVQAVTVNGIDVLCVIPPVIRSSYDNKPRRAFVDDYIMLDGQGYKVYRQADFERMYDELNSDMIDEINNQMDKVS